MWSGSDSIFWRSLRLIVFADLFLTWIEPQKITCCVNTFTPGACQHSTVGARNAYTKMTHLGWNVHLKRAMSYGIYKYLYMLVNINSVEICLDLHCNRTSSSLIRHTPISSPFTCSVHFFHICTHVSFHHLKSCDYDLPDKPSGLFRRLKVHKWSPSLAVNTISLFLHGACCSVGFAMVEAADLIKCLSIMHATLKPWKLA